MVWHVIILIFLQIDGGCFVPCRTLQHEQCHWSWRWAHPFIILEEKPRYENELRRPVAEPAELRASKKNQTSECLTKLREYFLTFISEWLHKKIGIKTLKYLCHQYSNNIPTICNSSKVLSARRINPQLWKKVQCEEVFYWSICICNKQHAWNRLSDSNDQYWEFLCRTKTKTEHVSNA